MEEEEKEEEEEQEEEENEKEEEKEEKAEEEEDEEEEEEEEEDGRGTRAPEHRLVQRAELQRAQPGERGAACGTRVDRWRLGRGCSAARGAPAARLHRTDGQSLSRLFSRGEENSCFSLWHEL